MILEKAWAKVHGGYFNTVGGTSREALRDLTGAPTLSVRFADSILTSDGHWQNLLNAYRKKFPMTASTHACENITNLTTEKDLGLIPNHGYSLLGVFELFKDSHGVWKKIGKNQDDKPGTSYHEIIRLVKLRNPWGQGEWKGKFSDASKVWLEFP